MAHSLFAIFLALFPFAVARPILPSPYLSPNEMLPKPSRPFPDFESHYGPFYFPIGNKAQKRNLFHEDEYLKDVKPKLDGNPIYPSHKVPDEDDPYLTAIRAGGTGLPVQHYARKRGIDEDDHFITDVNPGLDGLPRHHYTKRTDDWPYFLNDVKDPATQLEDARYHCLMAGPWELSHCDEAFGKSYESSSLPKDIIGEMANVEKPPDPGAEDMFIHADSPGSVLPVLNHDKRYSWKETWCLLSAGSACPAYHSDNHPNVTGGFPFPFRKLIKRYSPWISDFELAPKIPDDVDPKYMKTSAPWRAIGCWSSFGFFCKGLDGKKDPDEPPSRKRDWGDNLPPVDHFHHYAPEPPLSPEEQIHNKQEDYKWDSILSCVGSWGLECSNWFDGKPNDAHWGFWKRNLVCLFKDCGDTSNTRVPEDKPSLEVESVKPSLFKRKFKCWIQKCNWPIKRDSEEAEEEEGPSTKPIAPRSWPIFTFDGGYDWSSAMKCIGSLGVKGCDDWYSTKKPDVDVSRTEQQMWDGDRTSRLMLNPHLHDHHEHAQKEEGGMISKEDKGQMIGKEDKGQAIGRYKKFDEVPVYDPATAQTPPLNASELAHLLWQEKRDAVLQEPSQSPSHTSSPAAVSTDSGDPVEIVLAPITPLHSSTPRPSPTTLQTTRVWYRSSFPHLKAIAATIVPEMTIHAVSTVTRNSPLHSSTTVPLESLYFPDEALEHEERSTDVRNERRRLPLEPFSFPDNPTDPSSWELGERSADVQNERRRIPRVPVSFPGNSNGLSGWGHEERSTDVQNERRRLPRVPVSFPGNSNGLSGWGHEERSTDVQNERRRLAWKPIYAPGNSHGLSSWELEERSTDLHDERFRVPSSSHDSKNDLSEVGVPFKKWKKLSDAEDTDVTSSDDAASLSARDSTQNIISHVSEDYSTWERFTKFLNNRFEAGDTTMFTSLTSTEAADETYGPGYSEWTELLNGEDDELEPEDEGDDLEISASVLGFGTAPLHPARDISCGQLPTCQLKERHEQPDSIRKGPLPIPYN